MKDKLTLEDLYLIDSDCVAPNYFIVQIDSNSYVREGSFKEYFVTKIFWVKEIEDLYFHLLSPNSLNLECFNYIFYELNFPKKFSQKIKYASNIITRSNIKLNKYIIST